MSKFQKITSVTGWIAAAILALVLFVQDYIAKNPVPSVDSPAPIEASK